MTGALDVVRPGQLNKRRSGLHTRVARPRPSLLGSNAEKRQSSLTQLDFVSTPKNAETIEIWSDEGSDVDIDAEKPRKKRRVSGGKSGGNATIVRRSSAKLKAKEKGQNTLTQIAWLPASSKAVEEYSDDDGPGFNIYDDEGRDKFADMVAQRQVARRKKLPWLNEPSGLRKTDHQSPARRYDLRSPAKAVADLDDSGYISASTRSGATPAKRYILRNSVSAKKTVLCDISTATAEHEHDAKTPSKSSPLKEVPATQTPPSIKASSQRSHVSTSTKATTVSPLGIDVKRYPLGERSVNTKVRPLQLQPTAGSGSKTVKIPLNEASEVSKPAAFGVATASGAPSTAHSRTRQKLRRTLTVQDSQVEDFSIPSLPPPRQLIRSTTIAETQFDSLELPLSNYPDDTGNAAPLATSTQAAPDTDLENEQYLDDGPLTYDPVGAALDRDAARFAWTQTQKPHTHLREAVEDSETDEDDMNDLCDDRAEPGTVDLTSSPHRPSQQLLSDLIDAISPQAGRVSQADHNAVPDVSHAAEETADIAADSSPPSSPPPLRQSQISTVVPTQASPYQHSLRPPSIPATTTTQARVHATQHTAFGDIVSSSPLPLPPWSTPEKGDWLGSTGRIRGTQKISGTMQEDLGSLTDFSLPPPPPLMRSSSPWAR